MCFDTLRLGGREETTSHSVKIGSTSASYSALRWKQMLMDQNFLMEEKFQFLIKSVFYNVLKQKNFILEIKLRHNV